MRKILVSRCLYGGEPVRYDGKSKEETDPRFLKWKEDGRLIPVCPEVFGGLPVPRADAQRQGGCIIARTGADVTAEYRKGAEEAVRLAKEHDVLCAIMKEKSPSCGSSLIYDGTFSGKLMEGQGLAAEMLRDAGVQVFSEEELDIAEQLIEEADGKNKSIERKMKNIVLIGMPACGKSVTGVVLAKALRMKFLDTDLLIQDRAGKGLQDIINEDGIEAFKKIEEEALLSINDTNTVIATGGSAVYYETVMEHLKRGGIIVYIRASMDTIKRRLQNIKNRGVAMEKGQTLDDLYRIRKLLYERYADITVDTGQGAMEDTVETIMKELGRLQ